MGQFMFGFQLENDEWAAIAGGVILLARVVYLLMQFARRVVTDSDSQSLLGGSGTLLMGVAVAMLLVAVVSLSAGGLPKNLRIPVYFAIALMGFFLGVNFDFVLMLRLSGLGNRLRARRIPQYRYQLADADPEVRLQAARRLMSVASWASEAIPDLLTASRDESHEVRAYALLVMWGSQSDDAEIPRAARLALADPDVKVRAAAAVCLSRFKHPPEELVPALCEGLKQRGHQVAISSSEAIADLGAAAESALPTIRELALEPEHTIEASGAVWALRNFGPVGVPLLIEIIERGTTIIRIDAAGALEKLGEAARPAFPALRRMVKDKDRRTSEAAQRALRRLGADIT